MSKRLWKEQTLKPEWIIGFFCITFVFSLQYWELFYPYNSESVSSRPLYPTQMLSSFPQSFFPFLMNPKALNTLMISYSLLILFFFLFSLWASFCSLKFFMNYFIENFFSIEKNFLRRKIDIKVKDFFLDITSVFSNLKISWSIFLLCLLK